MGCFSHAVTPEVIRKWNLKHFVETGTMDGRGVEIARRIGFESIHTIEIVPEIADQARRKYENTAGIRIHEGTSRDQLPVILGEIPEEEPICFWLDAHFPGADMKLAGLGDEQDLSIRLPLESELEIIKKHRPGSGDVIIIDDLCVYEDGPFQNGNWAYRKRFGGDGIDFVYSIFQESHKIEKDYIHGGHILIWPKQAHAAGSERKEKVERDNGVK